MLAIAGKPHIIKEENFLLFGVVEEKALKNKSKVITFDFWSVRRNVLQDRRFNAAVVLQSVWRGFKERKRRRLWGSKSAGARLTRGMSRVGPEFFQNEPGQGAELRSALSIASAMP
jgi:hypothetical protein